MAQNTPLTFPFDIMWVAEQCDLLNEKVKMNGSELNLNCPLSGCGDRKLKFAINLSKNTWNCPKCGRGGGMVQLFAECGHASPISIKDATRELYSLWEQQHGLPPEEVARREAERQRRRKEIEKSSPSEVLAPIERRDAAYRALLESLDLSREHLDHLRQRGLSVEIIEKYGFKSFNKKGKHIRVPASIDTTDVAGFFSYGGKRYVNTEIEGFFIPYQDLYGRIGMMELRTFGGEKSNRYFRFSSGKQKDGKTGCSKSPTMVHHVGLDLKHPPKRVFFTEGALKADVASYLYGEAFIAVPGVNNRVGVEEALTELKSIGVEKIVFAFDMDLYTNPNVKRGLNQMVEIAKKVGFKLSVLKWNPEYKGIDDFLWGRILDSLESDPSAV